MTYAAHAPDISANMFNEFENLESKVFKFANSKFQTKIYSIDHTRYKF